MQKSQLGQQRSRHWIQTALSKQDCDGKSKHALTKDVMQGQQAGSMHWGDMDHRRRREAEDTPKTWPDLSLGGVCVCVCLCVGDCIFQGTGLPT